MSVTLSVKPVSITHYYEHIYNVLQMDIIMVMVGVRVRVRFNPAYNNDYSVL